MTTADVPSDAAADERDAEHDDDDDGYSHPSRPLGQELDGHFLSTSNCVAYLTDDSYEPVYESVPIGCKENTVFKVRMLKGRDGHKFWDDCGAWVGSHGKKTYHMPGDLTELRLMADGLYGVRKRVDGKVAVVALEPQPDNVVILHRLYSKLRRHEAYQRRITYVEGVHFFLAEYLGKFPADVMPHGNTQHGSEYVRSHPQVLSEITKSLTLDKKTVKRTYADLKSSTNDDVMRPRDRKQVMYI